MDFLPHEAKNQDDFACAAFNYYRHKATWLGGLNHREDVIEWLYKLGRDYNVLFMDYDEFRRVALGQHKNYGWNGVRWKVARRKYYCRWSHYCDPKLYRVLKGFTYSGQAKKNNPNKNDWWVHKGIDKDRRKCRWHNSWKRSLKQFGKRKHRQLERDAIKNERYDRLHRLTYKRAEDRWSWD